MKKEELKKHIEATGGATLKVDCTLLLLKEGYQVAFQGYEFKTKNIDVAIDKMMEYCNIFEENGFNVGVWFNEENGYYYVDISTTIKRLEDAMRLGCYNKQLSIYEWQSGNCIDL